MRTLAVRFAQHERNNDAVVEFLKTRPEIKTIFYPKLETHPNHDVFMRDYKGTNGMLTIEFADGYTKADAAKFTDALKLFACGASWGGYESLATVTTPPRTVDDWSRRGPFVRFHIGLEDAGDLIEDLKQALDQIKK
jgi:cystathionine beta-lyase